MYYAQAANVNNTQRLIVGKSHSIGAALCWVFNMTLLMHCAYVLQSPASCNWKFQFSPLRGGMLLLARYGGHFFNWLPLDGRCSFVSYVIDTTQWLALE